MTNGYRCRFVFIGFIYCVVCFGAYNPICISLTIVVVRDIITLTLLRGDSLGSCLEDVGVLSCSVMVG